MLTVVGGKVVYAAGDFEKLGPAGVPVLPDWSPVVKVPGHWRPASPMQAQVHHCSGPCAVHSHSHERARLSNAPVSDFRGSGAHLAVHVLLLVITKSAGLSCRRPEQRPSSEEFHMSNVPYKRLNKDDAVVLLVDHQTGLISLVQDFSPNEFKNNVLALGDIAKFFNLPTILTTSFDSGPNGPIVPELKSSSRTRRSLRAQARSTPGTTRISSRRSRLPAASN